MQPGHLGTLTVAVADVDVVDMGVGFEGEEEPDEVGSREQDGHRVHQGSGGHRGQCQCHQGPSWRPQGMEEMGLWITGVEKGSGRDVGTLPNSGGATPVWGQPCPHRSGHSLDMAVVEGAVVVHLQREHLLTGMWGQGTARDPGRLRASLPPNPPSGLQVPTHQVKVTAVAQVVAQRVLGDVVALATHQLPVHLGEERRGKDTCRDSTWSTHPPWGTPNQGTALSPTHLPQRGRAGPS